MAINTKDVENPGRTIIGESILVNGRLDGDEDLTVRGRVEGAINLTKTLTIEPSGIVKADVSVRNVIISGVVVGNVTASESVELTQEGRMVGDIRAPRVIIVDGASFRGRVDMGDLEASRTAPERPRSAPAPAAAPRPAVMAAPVRAVAPPPARPAAPQPVASAPAPAPAPRTFSAPPRPPTSMAPPIPPAAALAASNKRKVIVKKKK